DAHADLRDEYTGTKFSHACVMRRVYDLGAGFVQAGVRSMSPEEKEWLSAHDREVISARRIRSDGDWTAAVVGSLSSHVYITFDVDVLDPSEMPATGTPEPGGLSYHQVIDLVIALKDSGKEVVGLDLMELAPIPGLHHADFLAASLVYTMIGAFWPG
ncbi:MAG: arginase family protein, partial [bacterium]